MIRSYRTFACAFTALALSACAPGADDGSKELPTSLRDVEIPADFTFATTRAAAVTVAADPAILNGQAGSLEIRRPDGAVLYRGPLSADRALDISLSLPTKDNALELRLNANGQELIAQVPVADGQAAHTFR